MFTRVRLSFFIVKSIRNIYLRFWMPSFFISFLFILYLIFLIWFHFLHFFYRKIHMLFFVGLHFRIYHWNHLGRSASKIVMERNINWILDTQLGLKHKSKQSMAKLLNVKSIRNIYLRFWMPSFLFPSFLFVSYISNLISFLAFF